MLAFVDALYVSGFRDEVVALSPLVDQAMQVGPEWVALDGRLRRTRAGITAAAAGRWNDAERWFGEADEHARRSRNEMEVADLHRLRARMLLDRGRSEDAGRTAELLGQAAEAYRAFGMPGYVAEAERMLAGMPSLAPARRPRTGFDD
jgi:hypothetical protein